MQRFTWEISTGKKEGVIAHSFLLDICIRSVHLYDGHCFWYWSCGQGKSKETVEVSTCSIILFLRMRSSLANSYSVFPFMATIQAVEKCRCVQLWQVANWRARCSISAESRGPQSEQDMEQDVNYNEMFVAFWFDLLSRRLLWQPWPMSCKGSYVSEPLQHCRKLNQRAHLAQEGKFELWHQKNGYGDGTILVRHVEVSGCRPVAPSDLETGRSDGMDCSKSVSDPRVSSPGQSDSVSLSLTD